MCEAFLKRLGILKQLQRALSGDASLMHPKEELGIVADQKAVEYVVETVGREGKEAEGAGAKGEQMGGRLVCTVLIGEEAIVKVVGGVSRLEIETRAAEKAVRVLKESGKRNGRTQHEDHEVMEDIATVVGAHESQPEEERMGKRKREESGSGNEGDDYDVEGMRTIMTKAMKTMMILMILTMAPRSSTMPAKTLRRANEGMSHT